mmetsp:Transcript_11892/g.18243  ORF Transcript_11892/g.18243 Transcript_11892/m.18243 type:complete len:115 (-) Transcript_11892:393-737(-)
MVTVRTLFPVARNVVGCRRRSPPSVRINSDNRVSVASRFLSSQNEERDVEKVKTEKQFVALLRRIADSVEANVPWRIQVDKVRLTVPSEAEVSVEHEVEHGYHNVELQFKWPKK